MTGKPLEWDHQNSAYGDEPDSLYVAHPTHAWYWTTGAFTAVPVPGTYDGTIETAKQRCEEHRRKVSNG